MIRAFALGVVAAVLTATPVPAAEPPETLEELVAEYNDARQDWFDEISKLQEKGGVFPAIDMTATPEATFVPRFRAFAEEHAGAPAAVPALVWLVQNPKRPEAKETAWALEQLRERHAADGQLAEMMRTLPYASWTTGRRPVVEFCEKVLEVNEHQAVRAGATFALAVTLFDTTMLQDDGADVDRATRLFRQLAKEHAGTEYAADAASYLFEIDHLQVGMKAPEIVGTSPGGETIKLSQFEGQVVVLDFWGFW